jgi:hypothetical protein
MSAMPWRGPDYPGEFPTLGFAVAELIQARCVVPDGDHAGEPYVLTNEMLRFLLWHYRLEPESGRFTYSRGSQLVRPQKWGKAPFTAALVCAEVDPEGPVLFAGWDARGEPVGRPWATPWVQVTASSEDQTDNVWRALVPMIELGPLAAVLVDTGETRINLPSGGRIEPVTSSAQSRLGQRITLAVQDQTEAWTARNGGRALADTQRRNLAGIGGRFVESTNAWDPSLDSVAQQTAESGEPGVYLDDVEAGSGSIRNKRERRRMLRKVYGDSWWIDLDRIDEEVVSLVDRDPAQAERYFLNRKRAAADHAFDVDRWAELELARQAPPGAELVVGVDGARFEDALALVAVEVETGFVWPLGIWERPPNADDDYEHPLDEADDALVDAFERFDVRRVYVDPQWIDTLLDRWLGRWGSTRVFAWHTSRVRATAWAVRAFAQAVGAGDLAHNGDRQLGRHVANARKRHVGVFDDDHRPLFVLAKDRPGSPAKIDGAMAAVLAWEARGDAIAAGPAPTKAEPAPLLAF